MKKNSLPAITRACSFLCATLLLFLCAVFTACHDDDAPVPAPIQLPVNNANLAGQWRLASYNGHALAEGTYVELTLNRRDQTFLLRDNLQSMYGQERTGTYQLTFDEKTEQTILSGFYDNGVGEWANEYYVTYLTDTELHLTTTGAPQETSVYLRPSLGE